MTAAVAGEGGGIAGEGGQITAVLIVASAGKPDFRYNPANATGSPQAR